MDGLCAAGYPLNVFMMPTNSGTDSCPVQSIEKAPRTCAYGGAAPRFPCKWCFPVRLGVMRCFLPKLVFIVFFYVDT